MLRFILLGVVGLAAVAPGKIVVTNTRSSGEGSLTAAIERATAGNTISFDLPANDRTIRLAAPLPNNLRGGLIIDGGGQVEIAASNAGVDHALALVSPGNTVRGLKISGFKHGLVLYGPGAVSNTIAGNTLTGNQTGAIAVEGARNNTIEDNVISGNAQIGFYLAGKTTRENTLRNNRIGCDTAGTKREPNGVGVMIARSACNVIEGNTVSGNDDIGILLVGRGTGENVIRGNRIGTDSAGTKPLHNNVGIVVKSLADDNTIGGLTPAARNVISGNREIGIYIEAADGTRILGNFIGPDATGTRAVQEGDIVQGNGIEFNTVAKKNLLGGPESGARNVISGNKVYGVVYYGHCERNTTEGNFIGTDVTGARALPNATGICVDCASHHNDIVGNTISGNLSYGMFFVTRGTESNTLHGNRIGTDVSGTAALPNDIGMVISTGACRNIVGGAEAADRNIISGNRQAGLMITNRFTEENRVTGNFIGTDASGERALPNKYGVILSTYPRRNVVTNNAVGSNRVAGIVITEHAEENDVTGNTPEGSVVRDAAKLPAPTRAEIPATEADSPRAGGTPPPPPAAATNAPTPPPVAKPARTFTVTTTTDTGAGSLREAIEAANAAGGKCAILFDIPKDDPHYDARAGMWTITFADTPPSITVSDVLLDGGGTIVLSGAAHTIEYGFSLINAARVTIRGFTIGHFIYGIQIYGSGSHGCRITGCRIGGADFGNYNGIELISGAHDNLIGGRTAAERNLVAGNLHIGIRLSDADTNAIEGNFIGLDPTGTRAVPNYDGICIEGRARGNRVGGPAPGARNIISGNVAYGVDLFGWGVRENVVLGNYIGTDHTGATAVPNTYGVLFDDRASGNTVGGPGEGDGNLISGNTAFGAYFYNNGTCRNLLHGNLIGTDATGTRALPNETGVHIDGGTFENVVTDNLISGNLVAGITLFAILTDRNVITRNRIGLTRDDRPLGNGADGIRIASGPRDNRIGGTAEEANVIAHNPRAIHLDPESESTNRIGTNRLEPDPH